MKRYARRALATKKIAKDGASDKCKPCPSHDVGDEDIHDDKHDGASDGALEFGQGELEFLQSKGMYKPEGSQDLGCDQPTPVLADPPLPPPMEPPRISQHPHQHPHLDGHIHPCQFQSLKWRRGRKQSWRHHAHHIFRQYTHSNVTLHPIVQGAIQCISLCLGHIRFTICLWVGDTSIARSGIIAFALQTSIMVDLN